MRRAFAAIALVVAGLSAPASAQPVTACEHVPPVHHRMHGRSGEARQGDGLENTIAGMRRTYRRAGGRWFETDLQVLIDRRGRRGKGRMVLFHDYTLDRTTDETGVLRHLTYRQLPLTTADQPIPTFGQALTWISNHDHTHLLVEIKMPLPWGQVVKALKRYNFDGTHRIMFDIGGGEKQMRKHRVALDMKDHLGPYAVTGLKRWDPKRRPATYLRRFGTSVRLDLDQGIDHKRALVRAGVTTRFTKIINGSPKQPPGPLWRRAVESGAFTHIITERTGEYLDWCARKQEE